MRKSFSAVLALVVTIMVVSHGHADEAAVRRTLGQYVEVFNQKAAEKVGAFWTEHGTHTDRESGERTEGRAAIQADMTRVFEEQGDCRLSATISRIKFITSDVADVEGETTVVLSDAEPIVSAFRAIVVHQGDKWLIDAVEEFPLPQPTSSAAGLKELEWLIGEWVDDSDDVRVSTTFRWTANQTFLLRSFEVETKDGLAMTGTQVIGWDPRGRQIRSWSFNSDGSFGESTWTRGGNSWFSKTSQTLATGDVASGTFVVERMNHDSFTIRLIGHEVNGEAQATGEPVTLVRTTQKPASDSTPQKN